VLAPRARTLNYFVIAVALNFFLYYVFSINVGPVSIFRYYLYLVPLILTIATVGLASFSNRSKAWRFVPFLVFSLYAPTQLLLVQGMNGVDWAFGVSRTTDTIEWLGIQVVAYLVLLLIP